MSGQNVSTAVMQRRHVTVDKLDYYPTPPWATRAFMREVMEAHLYPQDFLNIWEPACGEGHMLHVLAEFAGHVRGSDVHDYGKGFEIGSFTGVGLDVIPRRPECDWIITNPPFNLALEFVLRALTETNFGVALLLRSAWSEGEARHKHLFGHWPPSEIVQYSERVPMVAGRYDPEAQSATAYSWFIWRHADKGRGTKFRWIAPGAYERNFVAGDVRRWAT